MSRDLRKARGSARSGRGHRSRDGDAREPTLREAVAQHTARLFAAFVAHVYAELDLRDARLLREGRVEAHGAFDRVAHEADVGEPFGAHAEGAQRVFGGALGVDDPAAHDELGARGGELHDVDGHTFLYLSTQ